MVTVKWEDYDSQPHERACEDMWAAMELSKHLKDCANITADIVNDDIVYVGAMGANVVLDGLLPNGEEYGWYKRRGTKDTKYKGRKK